MRLMKAPVAQQLATLPPEIDRLFDRFFAPGFFGAAEPLNETLWAPALDFGETEKEYVVTLDCAGIPRENLDVHLEGQVLTITGHREIVQEKEGKQFFWRERAEGRFARSVRLPAAVEESKIEAVTENGVLTVRLPRIAQATGKKITIK